MRILALLPRSTSTEVDLHEDGEQALRESVHHAPGALRAFAAPPEEGEFRYNEARKVLEARNVDLHKLDAVIAPGGMLAPTSGGVWLVNPAMLDDLGKNRWGEHLLNVGAFVAWRFGSYAKASNGGDCMICVVDPVMEDELIPEAKLSGIPEIIRTPVFHSLSQRGAARAYAASLGKKPEDLNLIVAHLGSEISVGAHRNGRVVDVNSPLDGEGPFSARTSGTLPSEDLVRICYSGQYDFDETMNMVMREGGLAAHIGLSRLEDVDMLLASGDERAMKMIEAIAYQTAREIGKRTACLGAPVDGIVLTGPWVGVAKLTLLIRERVEWIAPVFVYCGENEFCSLVDAAARVIEGSEEIHIYEER